MIYKSFSGKLYGTFVLLFAVGLMFAGCYSLKSASIPSELNTFYVDNFKLTARNALPTMSQLFSEALRNKILNESRLQLVEINPDISFSGEITSFRVSSVAPEAGQTAAFNRLEIGVNVDFENSKNKKQSWTKRFSFFEDFDRSENLVNVQEDLILNINNQLVEDIFNAAFTTW